MILSTRDRRALTLGGVATLLMGSLALRPAIGRWNDREELIGRKRDELARIRAIAASEPSLRAATAQGAMPTTRALRGRTRALAGAELQALLQAWADSAGVTVTQLDVVSAADSAATDPGVPGTISGIGELRSVARFLDRLQHGAVMLETASLSIVQNAVLKGGLLQFSVTVRAAWVPRE